MRACLCFIFEARVICRGAPQNRGMGAINKGRGRLWINTKSPFHLKRPDRNTFGSCDFNSCSYCSFRAPSRDRMAYKPYSRGPESWGLDSIW